MEENKELGHSAKKLSLSIFGDIENNDFSPKNVVSPPASHRESTGQTPRVMTFSMFGNTHMVAKTLHESTRKVSNSDDPLAVPTSGKLPQAKSLSARTSSASSAVAPPKRRSIDDILEYSKGAAAVLEAELMLEDEMDGPAAAAGADDGNAADLGNPQSNEICPYYLKGGCRFRKNCRLSHNIGPNCPYCGQDLPQTWTQQSKHLKRCWENGVEAEEWEASKNLACEICENVICASGLNFALLASCQHSLCTPCAEKIWDTRRQQLRCPACDVPSTCVMIRDRMYFDADRKSKMFGIYQKKLEARKARAQSAGGSQYGSRRGSNANNTGNVKRGRSSNASRS
eukprot:TRINITY_DN1835_c0_g1_i1.p1 TRINITY_DN1835_c0_g1~~TRINITY_DN1835_c0_g1_i1.p1  ORF type:complete len:342 (-),score=77.84 TRINITY_DN1835_c0_g1_i1:85-1110(-)